LRASGSSSEGVRAFDSLISPSTSSPTPRTIADSLAPEHVSHSALGPFGRPHSATSWFDDRPSSGPLSLRLLRAGAGDQAAPAYFGEERLALDDDSCIQILRDNRDRRSRAKARHNSGIMIAMRMRLLFVSTPISPIGAGDGGGVETTLRQLTPALRNRGHTVAVIAPAGSTVPGGIRIHQTPGEPPPSATTGGRDSPSIVNPNGVLERMWEVARALASQYDAIIGMTYDWISYYLTPFLPIPVLHWITLPSRIDSVDAEICQQFSRSPDRFAFYSRTQASTFPFVDARLVRIIPGAVDTDQFQFSSEPEPILVWAARISPEKGLEDAVRVAQETGLPLHVCGKIQDQDYWRDIMASIPAKKVTYHGLLSHEYLRHVLAKGMAMLVTPKWVEAFGLTVIEALACGTPVIAYDSGGPSEIVEHGKSGFLVPPNNVRAMVDTVGKVPLLRRADARVRAEDYSILRMAERTEEWAASVVEAAKRI
jgi:UDP-glucose:tetrahydrobiopterin glucosyltransferase